MPEKKSVSVYDLAGRKTKTIGVIIPRLDSPFITSALKGIQQVITGRGYELILTHSRESLEKEVANAQLLFDSRVDGVLASLSAETKDTAHFTPFTRKGIPIVFFDSAEQTCSSGTVGIDNARCGYLATEHLVRQGCRRIAIITSDFSRNGYEQRYRGFREALESCGLAFSSELLVRVRGGAEDGGEKCDGTEDGMEAARKVLRMHPLPDGLFITDDLTAAVCMYVLNEAGIRVPEDIAIVGFNNDPVGRLIKPALTTIDYPGFEIGKTAAYALLARFSGRKRVERRTTVLVPSSLIVRDSSRRAFNNKASTQ